MMIADELLCLSAARMLLDGAHVVNMSIVMGALCNSARCSSQSWEGCPNRFINVKHGLERKPGPVRYPRGELSGALAPICWLVPSL